MLSTDKKHSLSGMTLIEVIAGMTIIILVTVIAYIGVSASANYMQHGTDLRNMDGEAAEDIEENLIDYESQGADVTEMVPYTVRVKYNKELNGSTAVSEKTPVTGNMPAGVVEGTAGDIEYRMYVTYVTTVPEDAP